MRFHRIAKVHVFYGIYVVFNELIIKQKAPRSMGLLMIKQGVSVCCIDFGFRE